MNNRPRGPVRYLVMLTKPIVRPGLWTNHLITGSKQRALRLAKKLPTRRRQVDVRQRGYKPFVLEGSWL